MNPLDRFESQRGMSIFDALVCDLTGTEPDAALERLMNLYCVVGDERDAVRAFGAEAMHAILTNSGASGDNLIAWLHESEVGPAGETPLELIAQMRYRELYTAVCGETGWVKIEAHDTISQS